MYPNCISCFKFSTNSSSPPDPLPYNDSAFLDIPYPSINLIQGLVISNKFTFTYQLVSEESERTSFHAFCTSGSDRSHPAPEFPNLKVSK